MGAPYTITVDRECRLVRLTLRGLWDLATSERFAAEAKAAAAELAATGPVRILIDLRDHGVQSREVTERTEAELRSQGAGGARHAVLVSPSALHRMQAQRVGSLLAASFFGDEAEALAWLFQPPPGQAAAA